MNAVFEFLLINAGIATVLALGVGLLSRFRFRPAFLHLMWVVVLARLIAPPVVNWPVTVSQPVVAEPTGDEFGPIAEAAPTPVIADSANNPITAEPASLVVAEFDQRRMPVATSADTGLVDENAGASGADSATTAGDAPSTHVKPTAIRPPVPAAAAGRASGIDVPFLLSVVWMSGTASWLLLAVVRVGRFHKALRLATPASETLAEQTRRLAETLGMSATPCVLTVHEDVSPMVWPIGSASIILPNRLVQELSSDELSMLIGHELVHLRRRDHWVRFLEMATTAVFWWLPTVWFTRSQLRRTEESCCDAWVARTWPDHVADYSRALVEAARLLNRPTVVLPASGLGAFQALARRLSALAETPPPHRLSPLFAATGLIAAAVAVGNSFYVRSADAVTPDANPPIPEVVDRLEAPVNPDELPFRCDPIHRVVSPDGTKLAFVGRMYSVERRYGLFVADLETGAVRHLVKKALKTGIAWSPDSSRIAFANAAGYVVRYPLDIVDVATGAIEPTGILGHMPDWSPDGAEIACIVDRTRADGVPDGRIGVWNLETGSLRRISPPGFNVVLRNGNRYVSGAYAPRWSPDGRQIAYAQHHRRSVDRNTDTRRDVWVVGADGNNLRLVRKDAQSRTIDWSADSRSVAIDSPQAPIEIVGLAPAPAGEWPAVPDEAQRELDAEQAAVKRAAEYDVNRVLAANSAWQKPDYSGIRNIQFTHRMSPIRLDERFSWRNDGTWSVEALHREDEQAQQEIGRLWLTTGDNRQFTVPPKGRYPRNSELNPLDAVQRRFGHLMGTRANFVALDWGRTPELFDVVDVRPADNAGQTILELKVNYRTSRGYVLNFGAMFHSTSWSYLHDLNVSHAELTVDDATGRILHETSHTNYGPTHITFADWIEHDGQAFPGSIGIAHNDRQFAVDYRFRVLPAGVWLLESGRSQFIGKQAQLEELVDVQVDVETPDVAGHLNRIRAGLAELNRDSETDDLEFESNVLALGQREPLTWTGNDTAASSLTSIEFIPASSGQRFREVPVWPSLRAHLRFRNPFPGVDSAHPLLFVLYDAAGQPVQTHAIPIAAVDSTQRSAEEFLNRIRACSRVWLDPDIHRLPQVAYTLHRNKESQADYSIQQEGNEHYQRGVTLTTALDSFVAAPDRYRMPVYFTAAWNGRPVEVAVITGPRFGLVFGNGIENGWTGGYSVSARTMAIVIVDRETGRPLMERYGNTEVHFRDYAEVRPGQFAPRRIAFTRSDSWGIDFRFQVLDGQAWLLDRSRPRKPEYAMWVEGVTVNGQPPTEIVRTTEPLDMPVEPLDWAHVTDRAVPEGAKTFDRAMAEFVDFESNPQFRSLGQLRIVEPGHIEFNIGHSSFLKHARSWTLSRMTNDGASSGATNSRVTRTARAVPFRDGERRVLNTVAGESKTQLRSVEVSRNGNASTARIELVSQAHYTEQNTTISGVLFNPIGIPMAVGELTSTYRVEQPVYQSGELRLSFGDHPDLTAMELHGVFGVRTQTVGAPMGSRWGRFMLEEPVLPIPVLLSNANPDVWTVGLTELFSQHRRDIVRGSKRRGDHRRHELAQKFAPYRDAFHRLFETAQDPNGLALLCRLAGHSGDRSFVRRLVPLLVHDDEAIQDSAAIGLGLLGDRRASDRILRVAASRPVDEPHTVGRLNLINDAKAALDILGLTTGDP